MKVYQSISELIGKTPLVELSNIEASENLSCKLLAKLECFNPAGSVKDRVALNMINKAEERGVLTENSVIIEPTSGNTGIGLAAVAASRGYKVILTMPDSMSVERQKLLKAYGAEIVLTDGKLGMNGAIAKAQELAKAIPESFIPGQFISSDNSKAHYDTTGPEIWDDTDGKVDVFVAGVGTGGTITGTGEYLKNKNAEIKVFAVEPADSPVLSKGVAGAHKLQGIGAGFVPDILNTAIYDEVVTVTTQQAYEMSRKLATQEGFLVGISSGAALYAALQIAKQEESFGKAIVVLLPDTGDRYLSTEMFE